MRPFNHFRIPRLKYLLLGLLLPLVFGIANAQTDPDTTNTDPPVQEVIENYESEIVVREDGRLNVTENITIRNLEGGDIERGIYRYFPNSDFKIQSVKRNGDRATYRTEVSEGRKRIEIWEEDVYLDPGSYTYEIQYLTDQQIEDQGSEDQLYWNVTGQKWAFPIQQVQAEVILPEEISSDEITLNAFTGYEGKKGSSYEAKLEEKIANFATTRMLKEREGLSVIVNFPAGFIERTEATNRSTSSEQERNWREMISSFFERIGSFFESDKIVSFFVWIRLLAGILAFLYGLFAKPLETIGCLAMIAILLILLSLFF